MLPNKIEILTGSYRHEVLKLCISSGPLIGIELGVAEGYFSERMVKSGHFKKFFGVDCYADAHNTEEYKRALRRVGLDSNYNLLRMTFDEAYDLFPDNYFDFIYVDGYAHGGESGGQTIFNWYKKLKVGGVLAGDDYHPDWPLVVWAVDEITKQTSGELFLTELTEPDNPYCKYPSWAIIKASNRFDISPPPDLVETGLAEEQRIAELRRQPHI